MDYHVNRDGEDLGIFEEARLREAWERGELLATDLVWTAGMPEWVPLGSLPFAQPIEAETVSANDVRNGPAWEQPEVGDVFTRAWTTIKVAVFNPDAFFRKMRRVGGFNAPLLFFLVLGWIAIVLNAVLEIPLYTYLEQFEQAEEWGLGAMKPAFNVVATMMVAPVFLVLGAFVSAGITHLCLMMLGAANQPFETTFRCYCYGYGAVVLIQVVPICGAFVAGVWGMILQIIGIAKTHEISTVRAVIAVLLPAILCCGVIFMLVAAVLGGAAVVA
jgi:hypothetical protein